MRMFDKLGDFAGALGRGMVAGAIGTAAITLSTMLEARLRRRPPSTAPAEVAEKVLDIEPRTDRAEARLANLVHWDYGTTWGAARGLLDAFGVRGVAGTIAHFGAVWGAALVALPKLGVATPVFRWKPGEIAIDAAHHAVYAAVTGAVFDAFVRSPVSRFARISAALGAGTFARTLRRAGARTNARLRRVPGVRRFVPRPSMGQRFTARITALAA